MSEVYLFVGNLHWGLDEADVQHWFDVWSVNGKFDLIRDRATGESRCFGFLRTDTPDRAKKLSGELLRGKRVVIRDRKAK